jgi:hypothetical protein
MRARVSDEFANSHPRYQENLTEILLAPAQGWRASEGERRAWPLSLKLHPTFALWTNTRLSDTSPRRLQKAARAKIFTFLLRDGARIAELAEECNDTALKRTLSEHFLHHALAKVDRHASQRVPPSSITRRVAGDDTNDFEYLREVEVDRDGEEVPF